MHILPTNTQLDSPPGSTDARTRRRAITGGLVVGVLQVLSPLAFWWLQWTAVHGVEIAFIAAVYVGFAVADGRPRVIAVESGVAMAFVVLAAVGVSGSWWVLVAAYAAHGLKDIWQERTHDVVGTRWWPPFCATVDLFVAAALAGGAAVQL